MGSSAKKKKDKKKDFQKPKLRVGKTKPKPDNATDTSFSSKSIIVNQQSLSTSAPSSASQFVHYLSIASSSKSDTQRRDALAFLTTTLTSQPVDAPIPVSAATILAKLLPLTLDGSSSVRSQLLRLLRHMPSNDVTDHVESALLYIRAGMTHLAPEIRNDALAALGWLLESAKEAVVTCPGGWVKTLKAFILMMGWAESNASTKWTSAAKTSFGKGGAFFPKQMLVLSEFLKVGLGKQVVEGSSERGKHFPIWDAESHMIPSNSNPYAYLNLFGPARDEESEMYDDRESRQRIFSQLFQVAAEKGTESAKKEGGEMGRAAAVLDRIMKDSMDDYQDLGGFA